MTEFSFRKLKLGGYILRQRTESRMMNRFKKIFGTPEETIVMFGDFEQKQHRRFKEPIRGRDSGPYSDDMVIRCISWMSTKQVAGVRIVGMRPRHSVGVKTRNTGKTI